MATSEPDAASTGSPLGPVLFAFDGSELAKLAIEQAGRQLAPGRAAAGSWDICSAASAPPWWRTQRPPC